MNGTNNIAEGYQGSHWTTGVHVTHMLYADDSAFLSDEPHAMWIMPNRFAVVYARNKHLIVWLNTAPFYSAG